VSFESANFTLTAYLVCAAAGMFLGGFVSAKFNQYSEKVVAICMSVGALMLLLCATGWLGGIGTMIVLASTGLALGIGGPSRDMLIKKATPQGATGRVYGMVYSGLDVGFAVSPVIFGMFMDKGMFYAPLVGAAMALGVGVLMALKVGTQIESDRV
jgi:MFS family permease